MVIGWPKRSFELPAGTRIQPSLTQYSLTSVALLAVEQDADAALQRLGIVERAALVDAQSVGKRHLGLRFAGVGTVEPPINGGGQ